MGAHALRHVVIINMRIQENLTDILKPVDVSLPARILIHHRTPKNIYTCGYIRKTPMQNSELFCSIAARVSHFLTPRHTQP